MKTTGINRALYSTLVVQAPSRFSNEYAAWARQADSWIEARDMTFDDVFDAIVDATYSNVKLPAKMVSAIAAQLYADRRGGPLGALYASEEFMEAFEWQLS